MENMIIARRENNFLGVERPLQLTLSVIPIYKLALALAQQSIETIKWSHKVRKLVGFAVPEKTDNVFCSVNTLGVWQRMKMRTMRREIRASLTSNYMILYIIET